MESSPSKSYFMNIDTAYNTGRILISYEISSTFNTVCAMIHVTFTQQI